MRGVVSLLRFAAAYVTALGAHAQVKRAAAFLTMVRTRLGEVI